MIMPNFMKSIENQVSSGKKIPPYWSKLRQWNLESPVLINFEYKNFVAKIISIIYIYVKNRLISNFSTCLLFEVVLFIGIK